MVILFNIVLVVLLTSILSRQKSKPLRLLRGFGLKFSILLENPLL